MKAEGKPNNQDFYYFIPNIDLRPAELHGSWMQVESRMNDRKFVQRVISKERAQRCHRPAGRLFSSRRPGIR